MNTVDAWKNKKMVEWLDGGPLMEVREGLNYVCNYVKLLLNRYPQWSILDVACGPGSVLNKMLNRNVPITPKIYRGVDYSHEMLLKAKQHFPSYTFDETDITKECCEPTEIVVCVDLLQHLSNPTPAVNNLFKSTLMTCIVALWCSEAKDSRWNETIIVDTPGGKVVQKWYSTSTIERNLKRDGWKMVEYKIFGDQFIGIMEK